MPGYKIIESVGKGSQPVTKWSDIEHHHPSDHLHEEGRVYAKINGKAEEVAGDYNGTVAYTPGGQLMVSKDIILKNASNDSASVPVPSPANGYIGEVDKRNGTVTILDRPGGEVMFRLRHMKIDDDIKPGTKVEYGEPLGIQSGYGKGNPNHYGTHLHIDANVKYLDQADRYVRDMATGKITTDKHPTNTTNLVNEVPKIEHVSGNFPAPPKQALADGKIEFGEKGPDVALLQEKLRAAGARDAKGNEIKQDGDFGNGTKQGVENYQKAHNLPVTGVADKATLAALGVTGQQQGTPPVKPDTPTPPAKPDAPTPPAQNLPANVQAAKTDVEGWHLGQTSAKYETSNRGPGFISTGKGDFGGKSYGVYQFSSAQGGLAEYVAGSEKYGGEFKGLKPGSDAFDTKWKEVAKRDPTGFAADQHDFIKGKYFDVQNQALKDRGIDLSDRGRAVQDMMWSTSVQFRNLTPGIVANGLKEKYGEGYQLSKLSDEQIVTAVQDYKLAHNNTLFSKSPDLWPGLRARATNEKNDLVELARDEQTLKKAGVNVPMNLDNGPSTKPAADRRTDPMADGMLKKGEEGPAVTRLQEALIKADARDAQGRVLKPDGDYGDRTKQAVENYQRTHGLKVDGIAGKDTLTALGLMAPEQKKTAPEDKPQTPAAGDNRTPATNGEKTPAANGDKPPVQATVAPTQADKPSIANPNHPDHKLYQQAVSNLEQLGPSGGFKSRDELVKAAAAVAADAKATGLSEINHISRTTTPGGQSLLVAVEGDPRNPAAKNSYIDYNQAVNQTVDQSSKMAAEAAKPAAQSQPTPKVEEQTDKIAIGPRVA